MTYLAVLNKRPWHSRLIVCLLFGIFDILQWDGNLMLRSCCLTLIRHMTFLAFEVKLNTSQCRSHSHNWQGTSPIISLSCWNIMTYLAVFIIHGTQGSHCLLVIWLFWHFAMQLTSISALEFIANIRCHCLINISLIWRF